MKIPDKARSSRADDVRLLKSDHTEPPQRDTQLGRGRTLATSLCRSGEEFVSPDGVSSPKFCTPPMDRRAFLQGVVAGAAALAWSHPAQADVHDLDAIRAQIEKRHDEAVERLQEWIRQPSIAAENRGMAEGCELTMRFLLRAGFGEVTKVPTDGQPGIFATLDAGAPRTVGLYFMYDVKQADPSEWSSPPWEAALVEKPGLGKVIVGRGAVNQKGPEAAFLAALHAIRGAGRKLPVNLVFIAEGEEEIGSPHFPQIVRRPEVQAALRHCMGIFVPAASEGLDGEVTITLGAKGVVELELIASGERWGRGPRRDIHSSNKARVDSPAWHLVEALATLVTPDGNDPTIEGFAAKARPLSAAEKGMIAEAARRFDEGAVKKLLGVDHWVHDVSWREALELLISRPTVNIEGLVGGYTGQGGKTILPSRAVAKLDMRLVPDMTAAEALAALKAHLAKRGFGDIEVHMSGGYDPTSTPADSAIIRAETAVYRRGGIDPVILPRNAGSWPGYVFTGEPLHLSAGHFGLGHGSGAHAPDEYYVVESANPKVQGMDGAVRSFVEYLYELALTK
jgi:acetylornithine deacetylase/succinyl-diaminopimelate desuccinylase-like protein